MLFKTVYGPELESIYLWLQQKGSSSVRDLAQYFGTGVTEKCENLTTLEDALSFLETVGIVVKSQDQWKIDGVQISKENFKTHLIKQLRKIQENKESLDAYFLDIMDSLFIKPNQLFLLDLHVKVNQMSISQPVSEEKINAWKRVIEYLNLGVRGFGGFWLTYKVGLVKKIINEWSEEQGALQDFLEKHFNQYLPWKTDKGDIALALISPLEDLEKMGEIRLSSKQDLPKRSFFGSKKIKWIKKG